MHIQLTGRHGCPHRYRYGRTHRYVAAVFLLLLAPVLSPIAALTPRPPVALPMVAIVGMGVARTLPSHVRVLGPVPSDQPMRLVVGLAVRHGALLDGFLRARTRPSSPLYRHNLTPDGFTALFAPAASDQDALAAYLQRYGLRITRTYRDRLLLDVAGTSAQVSAAFGVSLARYRGAGGALSYANLTAPRLPADLAPLVTTVVGLRNDMALAHGPRPRLSIVAQARRGPTAPPRPRSRVPAPPSGLLTPAQVQAAFDVTPIYSQTFTSTTGLSVTAPITGAGQTVALYELSPYNPSDIAAYDAAFGITATPPISVPVDGGAMDTFSGSGAAEAAYDIEMVQAIAPGAHIIVYSGPASPSGTSSVGADDAYARAVNDDRAQVLSTSWGQCEQAQQNDQPPDLTLLHNLFAQAVAEGMTVVAASGDNGSHDCLNGDGSTDTSQQAVDYPASDPYVIAVGGTTLAPGGGNVETGWADSGGGSSIAFPRPPWQTGPGLPAVSDASARLVPDVALNAGAPYAVWVNNSWYPVKGTSAGAPVWAALLALTNQARYVAATADGAPAPSSCAVLAGLGDIHGALYTLGSTPAFTDVTDGPSNGIGMPGPGWDYVTGLGVPDAYLLLRALVATPALAPPNPGPCPSPAAATPTPQATATATASPVASVTPAITGAPTPVRPTPSPTGSTTPSPTGSTTPSPTGSTTPSPTGSTTPSPTRGRTQLVVSVTPRRVRPGGLVLLEVRGAGGPGRSIVAELRYPHARSQQVKGTTNASGAAAIRVRVPRAFPSRHDISVSLRVTVRLLRGRVATGTTNFHVVSL